MVDIEEVYVRDLFKKHNDKELYKGFYPIGMKTYQDDGKVVNEGFALDKGALEILRAKITATSIDELPAKKNLTLIHKVKANPDRQNYSNILLFYK